ncbi:DUF4345 domain-containing protein [Kangiella sp. HZ709]|uniref:DUF4345 domain-containing protein n=1 Tax=Kangiella sp. HZ709 TaxID=2666328 RepID=UPI0018A2070C|nr:DUF4345 domain-containing protein [Kangiella sp. HZ709]
MKLAKTIIWINALIFVVYGIIFLLIPVESSNWVIDTSPSTTSGLIDMRATYGGLTIAVGIIFYLLASQEATLRLGLISVIVALVSMAVTRFIGIIVDGNPNPTMLIYLVLEIVFAVVGLFAFIRLNK